MLVVTSVRFFLDVFETLYEYTKNKEYNLMIKINVYIKGDIYD
jgi:hypothetical protein